MRDNILKSKIEELAIEETVKAFLVCGATSPSDILETANKVTNEIINRYSLDTLESEKVIKELIVLHLKGLEKFQYFTKDYRESNIWQEKILRRTSIRTLH